MSRLPHFLRSSSLALTLLISAACPDALSAADEFLPPEEVSVLPVFFVPSDQPAPTEEQKQKLMQHLEWAQTRFQEMLGGRSTFRIARSEPSVYEAKEKIAFYKLQPEGGAPAFTGELLSKLGMNRYQCPFVLLVLVMNSEDAFPNGGGRPFNGGFNTGGGMLKLSSRDLDQAPNFQSTLQHELGHAFGLPHVDVYGYPLRDNPSIMSYNKSHHTDGFSPSETPGELIPEDVRGFAFNDRVFPGLEFEPETDQPSGYEMKKIITLGPMTIPGQTDGILAETKSGETYNSSVSKVVSGQILPSELGGIHRFDGKTMWHSAELPKKTAVIDLTFPGEVVLTRFILYTEHSGEAHRAEEVRVGVQNAEGNFDPIVSQVVASSDEEVELPEPVRATKWRVTLKTGESKYVVVRGIRFFSGEMELFSPIIPYPHF